MIAPEEISMILSKYDRKKVRIATLCSHSAYNIFYGARLEGFETIGIATPKDARYYQECFPEAKPDKIIEVKEQADILNDKTQEFLRGKNSIVVPHGSFVAYVGSHELADRFHVPIQGNRGVLNWESDRNKQIQWLKDAGVKIPRNYEDPSKIDSLSLVKFFGAKGGDGYFMTDSAADFYKRMGDLVSQGKISQEDMGTILSGKKYAIQEYIIGTRAYPHFFYSPFEDVEGLRVEGGRLQLLGYDKRDEIIDALPRLGLTREDREKLGVKDSYLVTGNLPMTVREKLQQEYFRIAESIANSSIKLFPPGMLGPFCPETICNDKLEIHVFEISCRIVAGTNMWIGGSPESLYTYGLRDGKPVFTGRRIAMEIKEAIKRKKLEKVVS